MTNFLRPAPLRSPGDDIERHTTWLEIFFDLIFVVIVTQLSARLYSHLDYWGILQCIALFFPAFWAWASYTVFAARFDNNDSLHWIMTFVMMFSGAIMAIQIPTALASGAKGYTVGFLISQISLLLLYARASFDSHTPKNLIFLYTIGFGLGSVCWIISLFFDPPVKLFFWGIGMFISAFTPWIGRKHILSKLPLHPIYIPERFGSFTIIIMGQTIAAVVFGLESAHWQFASIITSIMAFILALLIWGQYYRFTKIADYKCTLSSGQPFIYTHIPLIFSLIVIGVCAEDFIVSSTQIREKIYIIFCFAVILWIISFYLLQYIALRNVKLRGVVYLIGIIALLLLFLLHPLSPLFTMSGLVIIFATLFGIQFCFGRGQKA